MEKDPFFVAGIGASAGGHAALEEFFQHLPGATGIAFIIVTHLLRDHVSVLDRIVSRFTQMQVHRLGGNDEVRPDHVYVMPENVTAHMKNGRVVLQARSDSGINNAIDTFFHSLAKDQRERSVAIVFAGMGSDGLKGVQSIHDFGGKVLVQDPRTTKYSGMPESVIVGDSPDVVLPPAELASQLLTIVHEKKAVS